MTTKEILPQPESAYQLLLDAARAWPDGIATQWIPDPADPTRCLAWTYAQLAGAVTRIANALTSLGVKRGDAVTLSSVNTSMLYAATLAAQAVGIAAPVNPALITEALAQAGLTDARTTAAHENGRLVITVTGADPDQVRDAAAGFTLTVRSGLSPAEQTTSK